MRNEAKTCLSAHRPANAHEDHFATLNRQLNDFTDWQHVVGSDLTASLRHICDDHWKPEAIGQVNRSAKANQGSVCPLNPAYPTHIEPLAILENGLTNESK